MASGVIPQISVIMGPCAGGACYSPAICDYIFMTEETSQMYITGPAVVKSVTGEEITAGQLGGAGVHSAVSGVAHFVYPDDLECLNGVRRLIGYLPDNNESEAAEVAGNPVDACESIPEIVPSNPKAAYDVRDVIATFIDNNSFMEVSRDFAKNIVVGFAMERPWVSWPTSLTASQDPSRSMRLTRVRVSSASATALISRS